ncbi:hypothetical protein P171DRAFT_449340 [Karstenula rhodostoma CBS 690.94]|uniref:Uncharacterized protein n=1 Tax=Karstenula rhodostoma CBS 690.94 TaxID=1392251 RepID=A0A9P4P7Y2_9PLEO|nr:hypothetical protein P171DRAFT_449340 [Karstenula rhodostoma CBS 690.94]
MSITFNDMAKTKAFCLKIRQFCEDCRPDTCKQVASEIQAHLDAIDQTRKEYGEAKEGLIQALDVPRWDDNYTEDRYWLKKYEPLYWGEDRDPGERAKAFLEIMRKMVRLEKTSVEFQKGLDAAYKGLRKVADDVHGLILTKIEGGEYGQADKEGDGEEDFWKDIPEFGG